MEYSNPHIPEGINTSKEHPLKEFLLLTVGVFGTLAIVLFILALVADKIAHYLPYSIEQDSDMFVMGSNDREKPIVNYLQDLADKISKTQNLPEEMKITVYYSDDDTVNAYATLGGNVIFFKGLLEKLPNENALSMVMAHEIAHIKHRHPIRSLGSGVVVGLVVSILNSSIGDDLIGQFIGTTGNLTSFKFSREHETEADSTAIDSVKTIYGHLDGANELFLIFKDLEGENLQPEFLSTHPATDSRLTHIQESRMTSGNNQITPLPEGFAAWLEDSENSQTESGKQ